MGGPWEIVPECLGLTTTISDRRGVMRVFECLGLTGPLLCDRLPADRCGSRWCTVGLDERGVIVSTATSLPEELS